MTAAKRAQVPSEAVDRKAGGCSRCVRKVRDVITYFLTRFVSAEQVWLDFVDADPETLIVIQVVILDTGREWWCSELVVGEVIAVAAAAAAAAAAAVVGCCWLFPKTTLPPHHRAASGRGAAGRPRGAGRRCDQFHELIVYHSGVE